MQIPHPEVRVSPQGAMAPWGYVTLACLRIKFSFSNNRFIFKYLRIPPTRTRDMPEPAQVPNKHDALTL